MYLSIYPSTVQTNEIFSIKLINYIEKFQLLSMDIMFHVINADEVKIINIFCERIQFIRSISCILTYNNCIILRIQ